MQKIQETHYVLNKEDVQKAIAQYLEIDVAELSFSHKIADTTPDYPGASSWGAPSYGFTGTTVIHKTKG